MRMPVPSLCLLAALALVVPSLEAAVEVRITSGDLITGELVEETATTLQLKRLVLIKRKPASTTITLQKTSITMRKEVPSLPEQYQARKAGASNDLLPQCALARWCLDRALVEESLFHTRAAEALDKDNPIVAKLYADLGYLKEEGTWISEEEHLAKTGKVNLGGTIMTKEEAAIAKEKLKAASTNAHLEQQIRDAEWVIKISEGKITEATTRRDEAKSEVAKAKADGAGAKNRQEQLEKRAEARAGKNQTNRTQQAERDDQAALQEANSTLSKANAALRRWEKELDRAEEGLTRLKTSLEKAKAELPLLKKQLAESSGTAAGAADGAKAKDPMGTPEETKPAEPEGKPKSRFGGQ
jgi:hypothetical protein